MILKSMKNLITVSLLLFFLSIHGQNTLAKVSGTVSDSSGKPLSYGSVIIKDLNLGALTNGNGFYQINKVPEGKFNITISHVGYTTLSKTVQISKTDTVVTVDFMLQEDIENLDEVTVSSTTEETKTETKGFAVNVVETKEASLRNFQTNELLNTTVGVKIRQNGGLGSNVEYSLNGLSGNSITIFIDGIPVSMYGSSFSLNSIPPSMIKNIEVYKGVVPGHLTDDALGGVINIVLHKGAKNYFNASTSYGSFNTSQSNFNGLYRFKNSGFTIKASAFHNYSDNDYKIWGGQVRHTEIDGSQTPIVARRFHDAYRSTGGMAQIGFTDVKWADQFLIGFTGSDDFQEIQHGAFITITPYKGRFLESNAKLANLTYLKKDLFTKGLDVNITGLYGKRKRVLNDTVADAYTWLGVPLQRQDFLNPGEIINHVYPWGSQSEQGPTLLNIDRKVASIRTGVSYELNQHHKLLLNHVYSGLDREDTDEAVSLLENTFQETKDLYKNIFSLSYELNALEDKLKFNLFGKHYRQKVTNTSPILETGNDGIITIVDELFYSDTDFNGYGFASSYAILPNITLLASAERAIRLPNETEVFGDAGDNVIENPLIQPEISNNINLGFRFGQFNIKKHQFTLSTNLFSRNIQDLIGFNTNDWDDDELVQYANFDEETNSKGIEAQLSYTHNNNFGFNFNFSKLTLETRNVANQIIDIPNTPLFTINSGLRYSIKNFIQKKARLNLFFNAYFTDEFSYIVNQGSNNTGLENFLIPKQFIQDFGLSYLFPKNNFVVSFDVKNILDKAAYDNQSVQKPGRAFYLKINYTINKFK